MTENHVVLMALKRNAQALRECLEACEAVATDNAEDWWEPLVDCEVEQINPCTLAVHAKEGAHRARAALLLLHKAVDLAGAVERTAHSPSLVANKAP